MSNISFVKYEAAGNDFILIDGRLGGFPKALTQSICHRKYGIGADGLIFLLQDAHADFAMRIFNSDGSEAESCGNGLRCLLHFGNGLGVKKDLYRIAIGGRVVFAYFAEGVPVINMGMPSELRLRLQTSAGTVHFVDSGVPHAVHFVSDVLKIDFHLLGSFLRNHGLFQPKGANVDFASFGKEGIIHVRTFERGVEGETLSCGTGAVAVAAIAQRIYGLQGLIKLRFLGGDVQVFEQNQSMYLQGPVRAVFSGSFNISNQI